VKKKTKRGQRTRAEQLKRQADFYAKVDLMGPSERKLYRLIHVAGERGHTCQELERATGWSHETVSARLYDMRHGGLIVRSDDRRPTRSGRLAYILITAEVDEIRDERKPEII
jgi:predicted transcriptional regulator